jgi:glycosyltransferase involved in cell wall biosynthesis
MSKKRYKQLFITRIPSFYKILLYNRIAEKQPLFVIFLRGNEADRNADFIDEPIRFEHATLPEGSGLKRLRALMMLLVRCSCEELVVGGWDRMETWVAVLLYARRRNSVVVESSYIESETGGGKALMKRLFLSRISKAYCPGVANRALLDQLGFRGRCCLTGGVGLFRRVEQPPFRRRERVDQFLYVGRFSPEKNLPMLIRVFNQWPQLTLNLVGFGPMEAELRALARDNIRFHGAVANQALPAIYQANDVFVLPSLSETWGLVVEEALNNGLPVLVSDCVGCSEAIVEEHVNGLIFRADDEDALSRAVERMIDLDFYHTMSELISGRNPEVVENQQVRAYLHA